MDRGKVPRCPETGTKFTGVVAKNNYRAYKPELRIDFNSRCGYCDTADEYSGGARGYQIDHFAPKSKFAKMETDYINLVYCCPFCNRAKSNKWIGDKAKPSHDGQRGFVDPCDPDFDNHIERDDQGRVVALSELGQYMISNLNLQLLRHQFLWQAQRLDKIANKLMELKPLVEKGTPEYIQILEELVDVFTAFHQGNRMSFTARGFEAGSGCSSLPFSAFLRGSSRFLPC